jgi:two-component system KDP operon response regulator KdpE
MRVIADMGIAGKANPEGVIAKGGIVKTLLIEDDPVIVESISLAFRISWPEAQIISTRMGRKGIELAQSEDLDVIVLDLGIPDISSVDVMKQVRLFSSVPIIILTFEANEVDIVGLLELGADDYIVQPCGQSELITRVKARVRDKEYFAKEAPISFGPMNFNPSTRQLVHGKVETRLIAIEARIMHCLMKSAGHLVTYSSLVDEVWGEDFPGSIESLRIHIKRLRGKLESDPNRPKLILDKPGTGYYLASTG